jgi:hypothetical protein
MSDIVQFPANPNVGDVIVGKRGEVWVWDGRRWSWTRPPEPEPV